MVLSIYGTSVVLLIRPFLLSFRRARPFAIVWSHGHPGHAIQDAWIRQYLRKQGGLLRSVTVPPTTSHISLTMPPYRIERYTHVNENQPAVWPDISDRKRSPTRG